MTSRTGTAVFRAVEGPLGTTWADSRRDDRYSNAGDRASGSAA